MIRKLLITSGLLLVISNLAQGQSDYVLPKNTYHKNIYGELLGSHILIGVNFDMRLKPGRQDGIGFRAGIGGINLSSSDMSNSYTIGLVTFPLEFNHLVGSKRSSFVTGIGLLPVYATISGQGAATNNQFVQEEGFALSGGFLTLGYRLQPLNNGFMMQINWNPLIIRGTGFMPGWLGIGLGLGFK